MSEKTLEFIRRIVAARAFGYCEYCRCSNYNLITRTDWIILWQLPLN